MNTCLENYYRFLDLVVDVDALVFNVKSTFYSLYDEYLKFYDPNLTINIQQNASQVKPPLSTRFSKRY